MVKLIKNSKVDIFLIFDNSFLFDKKKDNRLISHPLLNNDQDCTFV